MDIDNIINGISTVACKNLQNDGFLTPIAFLFMGNDMLPIMMTWKNDDEKYAAYKAVGELACQLSADVVLLLNDVAMRYMENKEDIKYVIENYDTERPTMYPESLRQDMICLSCIDFKTFDMSLYTQKYKKENGEVIFEKLEKANETIKGELYNMVLSGYKKI